MNPTLLPKSAMNHFKQPEPTIRRIKEVTETFGIQMHTNKTGSVRKESA